MTATLFDLSWPLAQLHEGIDELGLRSGLRRQSAARVPLAPLGDAQSGEVSHWLAWAAEQRGLDIESVETPLPHVQDMLRQAAPAILRIGEPGAPHFLLLLRCRGSQAWLLGPDLSLHRVALSLLREALCAHYEAPIKRGVMQFLEQAALPATRASRVATLMVEEQLATQRIADCWLLRLPPSAPFWQQLRDAQVPRRALQLLVLFTTTYLFEIAGWALIGSAALAGRLDQGWLMAWMLMIVTLVPLHLMADWLDRWVALDFGRVLKKRLLHGALQLDLDMVKRQGAGQLLSRVLEAQALESLALNGGFGVLVSLIELGFAAWVLLNGAGGKWHLALLTLWLLILLALCRRYYGSLREWTLRRLHMTHDLVERMVGHRTCLAQEPVARRDSEQDTMLNEYLAAATRADGAVLPIVGGLSRGWLLAALVGLAPAFIAGTAATNALAISLGGVLLANRAFAGIAGGLAALGRAAIAWQQVKPLFMLAAPVRSHSYQHSDPARHASRGPILTAQRLRFHHEAAPAPVLDGVDLRIDSGDRILLQGASGGGKSTLAALLTGLRRPDAGLMLLNGLDMHTLGPAWHRHISAAPQFHENHILSGTLAFNLLMGREWPASEQTLQEATMLCEALGLGPLLERMPSGLRQMVGETGWQLSHGERSRIYLARALLQNSQLTILDESFAALDPESLQTCLQYTCERANGLLVIAHP